MKEAKSLNGIIAHLTVQEKGILTITSSSVRDDLKFALTHVAALPSDSCFYSKDEPCQWICWDFRKMRVHLTHYTHCAGAATAIST
jgi:hypothetical protein